MSCNKNCKICNDIVISTGVSVVTVDGTDTLVIDLPTGTYPDRRHYCIVVAQTIPVAATIAMPVAFSIGGVTTTVYPFMNCNCTQVTACAIQTRTRYPVTVSTNTVSGVFRSERHLCCYPSANLASLPVAATTPAAGE